VHAPHLRQAVPKVWSLSMYMMLPLLAMNRFCGLRSHCEKSRSKMAPILICVLLTLFCGERGAAGEGSGAGERRAGVRWRCPEPAWQLPARPRQYPAAPRPSLAGPAPTCSRSSSCALSVDGLPRRPRFSSDTPSATSNHMPCQSTW
jgi:hypothetical protein